MIYASVVYALFGFLIARTSAIRIPLTVAGSEYQIDFNPETATTNAVAQEFCIKYADTLQLTRETFHNCVSPVQQHLDAELARNVQLQSFPLTIGGSQYEVRFDPRVTPVEVAARDFCLQNGGNFGITQETLNNCINPVTTHLTDLLRPARQQQSQATEDVQQLTVTLEIGASKYEIQFAPAVTSPAAAARSFCIQNAAALGVTDATLPNCVNPVIEHLEAAVVRHTAPVKPPASPPAAQQNEVDVLQVSITIGGNEFEIRFPPSTMTAEMAARDFCIKHADVLGVTRETFGNCLKPVTEHLQGEVTRLFSDASNDLSIPIKIGDAQFQIRYNPSTQDVDVVARDFCIMNAGAIGIDEEALPNCVLQVGKYVRTNVQNVSGTK